MSKLWPAWMSVMLGLGVWSACGFPKRSTLYGIAAASTAIFLPLSLRYVRMEGGTMPMIFFATLGSIQLGLACLRGVTTRSYYAAGCYAGKGGGSGA